MAIKDKLMFWKKKEGNFLKSDPMEKDPFKDDPLGHNLGLDSQNTGLDTGMHDPMNAPAPAGLGQDLQHKDPLGDLEKPGSFQHTQTQHQSPDTSQQLMGKDIEILNSKLDAKKSTTKPCIILFVKFPKAPPIIIATKMLCLKSYFLYNTNKTIITIADTTARKYP